MHRRTLLSYALATSLQIPSTSRAALSATPAQTRGPFYPSELPADADHDLVRVAGSERDAEGVLTHLSGRILDHSGRPLAGARVEIWQCDARGRYHHPWDRGRAARDRGFQGYGHFVTGDDGAYRFRTIRPVPYPGRTPHVHFAVSAPGGRTLVTQMYVAGEPRNEQDGILNRLPRHQRERLLVALRPRGDRPSELTGTFEIVLPAVL